MAGQRANGARHMGLLRMPAGMGDVRERGRTADYHPPGISCARFGAKRGSVDRVKAAKLTRQRLADQLPGRAPLADCKSVPGGNVDSEPIRGLAFVGLDRLELLHQRFGGSALVDGRGKYQRIRICHAAARRKIHAKRQGDVEHLCARCSDPVAMRAERCVHENVSRADPESPGIARLLIATG
jgi:hypothetical protein